MQPRSGLIGRRTALKAGGIAVAGLGVGSTLTTSTAQEPTDLSPETQLTLYLADRTGAIHALDATTGAHFWEYDTDVKTAAGTPLVAKDTVYLAENPSGLHAIDRQTGEQKWKLAASNLARTPTPPTVRQADLFVGTTDREVTRFDSRTGYVDWSNQYGYAGWRTRVDNAIRTPPVVHEETVYVMGERGVVFALNRETGSRQWVSEVVKATQSRRAPTALCSPADESGIIAACGRQVGRLNPNDGQRDWRQSLDGQMAGPPAIFDGQVYVCSDPGTVTAFEATSGARQWQRSRLSTSDAGGVALTPDLVLAVMNDPGEIARIYALDRTTGEDRWQQTVRSIDNIEGAVTAFGQTGFLASVDGEIRAIDLADGTIRWTRDQGIPTVVGSPVVVTPERSYGVDTQSLLQAYGHHDTWGTTAVTEQAASQVVTETESAPAEDADSESTPEESPPESNERSLPTPGFGLMTGGIGTGIGIWKLYQRKKDATTTDD